MGDDNSQDIGYLKAKAEETDKKVDLLFTKCTEQSVKLDEIKIMLSNHIQKSNLKHEEIVDDLSSMVDTIEYCRQGVDSYYTIRKFGLWLVGIVTTAWAAFWQVLSKFGGS